MLPDRYVRLLKIKGKCSRLRAKYAHISGHLPQGPLYDRLFDQRQQSNYADLVHFGINDIRTWYIEAQAFVDTVAVLIQQALAAALP